jgi:hypothetical protein
MNERAVTGRTAVRLNPPDAASHKALGFAYAALGQRDKAAAAPRRMRQYVPSAPVGGTEPRRSRSGRRRGSRSVATLGRPLDENVNGRAIVTTV